MTINVVYRAVRKRRAFSKAKDVRRSLENVMRAEVEDKLIAEYQKRVANWENQPDFEAKSKATVDRLETIVTPIGENAILWTWVSGGTDPHPIPASSTFLRFEMGEYRPKTEPGNVYGGPGDIVGAQWITKDEVDHPGIEAREFEKYISEEFKPEFRRIMENAWRRIIRSL